LFIYLMCSAVLLYFYTNIDYDISMKACDKMNLFQQLDQMVEEQDGILRTAQDVEAGLSKPVVYECVKDRKVEPAAHGIYVSKDSWIDAMYLIHLRFGQAVFSHETALFFHDLTDREPMPYTVTLKTGYNPARLKVEGVQVYTIK